MLRSLGCDDRGIQRAIARFLSASTPEYGTKTLTFVIGASDGTGGNCLPKSVLDYDALAKQAGEIASAPLVELKSSDVEVASPKKAKKQAAAPKDLDFRPYRERGIGFDFQIRDSDAAKRFFAPLPDWHTEALQHKIEVARVPDWMKPGAPPASWSFTDWLDSRSPGLILAAGVLAFGVLCFVVGSRIDRILADAQGSAGAARVSDQASAMRPGREGWRR